MNVLVVRSGAPQGSQVEDKRTGAYNVMNKDTGLLEIINARRLSSRVAAGLLDEEVNTATYFGANAPTKKGRDRVLQILKISVEILVRDGAEGLTLRQVAREASMALSNLQHYYTTREELIYGIAVYIRWLYEAEYDAILENRSLGAVEKLKSILIYLIDDLKRPFTSSLFFELWSIGRKDSFIGKVVDGLYTLHRRHIESLIAVANPELPDHVRSLRAALMITQIEGLMLLIAHGKPPHPELRGLEEECVRQLLSLALSSSHADGQ